MTLWSGRVARRSTPPSGSSSTPTMPSSCRTTARRLAARAAPSRGRAPHDDELTEVGERLAEIAQAPPGTSRRRGRAQRDRAAAGRARPQDPRRPLTERPGRCRFPSLRARRVRGGAGRDRRARAGRALVRGVRARHRASRVHASKRGQPVTLGHHLLAWVEMLERTAPASAPLLCRCGEPARRGRARRLDARTPPPAGQMRNSIDAVSDRDFALDYLYAAAVLYAHLSRIGEEIVLWSTGSSASPACRRAPPRARR